MIGENSDDLMRMSSSDESPKELEEVTKAPTNAKNKRKGKKIVEATSERDWIRASHDPIILEESLLALENMEEGGGNVISERREAAGSDRDAGIEETAGDNPHTVGQMPRRSVRERKGHLMAYTNLSCTEMQ
ncbi:hypothetical protein V6N12_007203 [Hibiscus sabdariffa]|uniref:Uncharacterized protein n=1 Tax=Hibiscus sabdariffa TaxID=183260 RepID=A0ABR2F152_9ROSI